MASRRAKLYSVAAVAAVGACGWFLHYLLAAQAQGALAQAPLNNQVQVPPAFIMAVDNSGSMTFHNQFPASDGYGCWSGSSFFSSAGVLRTSGTCRFAYSYIGPRAGANFLGIPPVDNYGFARSPDFNPSYFDPEITYQPWLNADGTPYGSTPANPAGNASTTATRLDPRDASPTVDLVSQFEEAAQDRSRFNTRTNMFLPQGTRYRLSGNNNASCGGLSNGGVAAWQTIGPAGHTVTGNCVLYISYWPATFYLRETVANTAPTISAPGYAGIVPVRIPDACGTGCHLWRYTITSSDTVALQNFANWFSFYGNRNRSMIAGMTRSMASVNNMRVGYFRINSHGSFDEPLTNPAERVAMRDMGMPADRSALYTDMINLNASGSTPNRQAVNAGGQQFRRTDAGAPVQLACQRNALMLFTDGFSNQGGPAVGNVDQGMGVPFTDGHSDTMADIATRYYLNDGSGNSPLRTDLTAGQVPIPSACPSSDPKVNCQNNLHVNFYGVTLGGRGNLFDPDNVLDPYVTPAIYNNWPNRQDDNRSTVDDIWHATVNTRGELVNARTPADITEAMRRILSAVSAGASPSGTLALTGSRISTRSLTVQPSYEIRNEGTDWFSELAAFKLEMDSVTRLVSETAIWEASDRLDATSATTRKGHTWYGHATGASRFDSTNITTLDSLCDNPRPGMSRCNAAQITALGIGVGDAIDYLMGETSGEVRNGGTLRDRTTVLGDIVNSTPVVSAPTDDYGYRTLPAPYGTSYDTYMTSKQSRPAMVYVGANDGMLHAFHGGIDHEGTVDAANGGREQFAFVPRTVLGHMGNLLFPYVAADGGDQKFDHRYYVDGPVTVSDAYYGGSWKTVLVGTTGAGGRGVFGLNVSAPTSFTASSRLWEVDDQHATAAVRNNIGHVLGKPVIVPVKSGGTVAWKAIFGNGYNSQNGLAVLFVVDIATGAVQMTQAVEPGAPTTGSNGLGNIVVVDRWGGPTMTLNARDGYADTVYAADQKGALWKFDLRTMATSISTPLFTTREHTESGVRYRQPIIGGLTATAGRAGGVMILFGTGSFSFVNDAGDDSVQSIYGVLDTGAAGTLDNSDLLEQTIVVSTADTRTISNNGPLFNYSGWYVNLPAGERAVGYPRVASGVLFIPTYSPTIADGCSTRGMNWLYGLNTRTGGPALAGVRFGSTTGTTQGAGVGALALDTAGTAPVKDVGLTVLSKSAPPNPGQAAPPDDGCWMRITVPGMTQAMFVPYPCGRQSWRQIE